MLTMAQKKWSRPGFWGWSAAALGLWLGIAGCGGGGTDELLVAYSGDCQAYIEPCG